MDSETTPLSFDDVVSFNLRRARDLRGWTQQEAAEEVSKYLPRSWSVQVYGDAERAYKTDRKVKRVKVFSADELVALCRAFNLPLAWWLLPPDLTNAARARGAQESGLSGEGLLVYLFPVEAELLEPLHDRLKQLVLDDTDGTTLLDRLRSSGEIANGLIRVVQLQLEDYRQQTDRRITKMIDEKIQANLKVLVQQEIDRLAREPESEA